MKYLIIPAIVFILTSCNSNPEGAGSAINSDIVNNPASASGNADTSMVPVFEFVKESHDFGKIRQGEKVSYNFKFKNKGKSDLLISSATASCGCTVPEYPKQPIAPGGEGNILVTFDSAGKEGKVSKNITITANTIPNSKVLTITSDIQPVNN